MMFILLLNGIIILHLSGFDDHMQTCSILQLLMCIKPFNTNLEVRGVSFIFSLLSEIAGLWSFGCYLQKKCKNVSLSESLHPLGYIVEVGNVAKTFIGYFFIIIFLRIKVVNQT